MYYNFLFYFVVIVSIIHDQAGEFVQNRLSFVRDLILKYAPIHDNPCSIGLDVKINPTLTMFNGYHNH